MRVSIGNKTFIIGWRYQPSEEALATTDTVCTISEVQTDGTLKAVVQSVASCSITDNFKKETGRKLSLQRAVNTKVPDPAVDEKKWQYIFVEEDRVRIWQEFFKSRGLELPKELVR